MKRTAPPPAKLSGLDILFGESTDPVAPTTTLSPSQIIIPPWRLRRYFETEKLLSLGQSLQIHGIGQPISVRVVEAGYELVVGERRLRAAQLVGIDQVPVFVIENLSDVDAMEVSLAENLYKESLNPYEESNAVIRLLALRLNVGFEETLTLLKRMKRHHDEKREHNIMPAEESVVHEFFTEWDAMTWESFVKNRVPIFSLPADILAILQEGRIEYTKARLIARIQDESERSQFLEDAIAQDLSVREIRETLAPPKKEQPEWQQRVGQTFDLFKGDRIQTIWNDGRKRKRLERLLGELESLLQDDEVEE